LLCSRPGDVANFNVEVEVRRVENFREFQHGEDVETRFGQSRLWFLDTCFAL
jgi:hypothetical protein